ncbi:hypothetical protein FB563_2279 [Streptomyces puniciscabiei]|uniref:Uncharacterized protein n=1 Tax=Streptomyces puniciscabiei TaxID=164348 RepID=A0A542UE49_9ACTN|nr:hypothetical protein [Streptomyces puniciscabiei]TQK97316.1 hypothetical protein FB563_2279 [Streptomyces puniciscabiei]
MTEETTTPSPATPDSADSGGRSLVLGCLGCGGLALVGVLVLVVRLAWSSWGATDFPRVAPEEMAGRALRYSQEAYDVMGFTRPVQPGAGRAGAGTEDTFSADPCYDGGLLGLEDKTVGGAYRLYHSWALDRVPESRAVPGLRRLHQRLKDEGWVISSYRAGGKGEDAELYAQRDGGEEQMSFDWYAHRQYFSGGAGVPCAYDPAWTGSDADSYDPDSAADSLTPPVLGPSSGR